MRRLLYAVIAVLLFAAVDASAQCFRCEWDLRGCSTCAHTFYNAYDLCRISNDGYACYGTGDCEGALGGCGDHCIQHKVELRPVQPKLQGEWRLVSVELTRRISATTREKRRS